MFQIKIANPCDETLPYNENESFCDIKLKFKRSFYGKDGDETDRTIMKIEELEIENMGCMDTNLKMEDGLIEFITPKKGRYQIIQQSRSSNQDDENRMGPAMGVNIQFELDLEKVNNIKIFTYK